MGLGVKVRVVNSKDKIRCKTRQVARQDKRRQEKRRHLGVGRGKLPDGLRYSLMDFGQ